MARFPSPPEPPELAKVPPDLLSVPAGWALWRVYKRGGPYPVLWNTFRDYGPVPGGRFDHHLPDEQGRAHRQSRAIYYAAREVATCVAEFFQDTRSIERDLEGPALAGFRLREPVTLLDLTGLWPTRAGASMAIGSGERGRARLWSRAIYKAYPDVQGLFYASAMHANRPAIALYERALPALETTPIFNRPLSDPALFRILAGIADDLRYEIR